MYKLEIQYPSQPVESRKLSKSRPISIGRHSSNDICIDGEDVAALHCRISWSRGAYEVSTANKDGVDLNGTFVRNATLKSGDLLRIGSVDISITSDEPARNDDELEPLPDVSSAKSEIALKPVSEDELRSMRRVPESPWVGTDFSDTEAKSNSSSSRDSGGSQKERKESPRRTRESREEAASPRKELMKDDAIIDLGDDDAAAEGIVLKRVKSSDEKTEKKPAKEESEASGIVLTRTRSAEEEEVDEGAAEEKSLLKRVKEHTRSRPVRPGEEDTLRSPFVLGMGAAAVFLALAGAVFWLVIGRESAQRAYDSALEQYQQGKFTQSIELFQKFLEGYPQHHLSEDALDYLWKSRIEKEISGGVPAWKRGYTTYTDFISASNERPKSDSRTVDFRTFAERIATGAAESATANPAASANPRELLEISESAKKKVAQFSGSDGIAPETAARIASAIEKAEAAIRKQETFDARVATIELSLADRKPMAALQARLDLFSEYPEYEKHPKMAALLAKTLETERGLVTREELGQEALVDERPMESPLPLSLTLHTRSRTDEASIGRTVFATAADCCYGIDSVTGEPVWRRVIGLDTPFFPVPVSTKVPGLLMFDTRHAELVLVDQRTGKLVWRQPLAESMSGAPLIHEGQIYVPTLGNHLYKVDLESGRISTKLTFSQMVLAPPALVSGGERLVVAGDKALFYTLTTRPLDCMLVTYTAHSSGTITSPLLTMGSLILVTEGSQGASSRLRVLDAGSDDHWLDEVAQASVEGQLRDQPVIRGKELFVSSSGERITAFTVSDDPGQRTLTRIAAVQVQTPHPGPMYLSPGPDGQLWMAGSAVRKLQLKTESIKLEADEVAAGNSSQPLQNIGQYLYTGRRLPYSSAVLFTQADRESMTGLWRIVLGSRILASTAGSEGRIVCLTEGGEIYQLSTSELEQGGFKRSSSAQLKIPAELNEPLSATTLPDGRIVAYCGGAKPQLWVVNVIGQVESQVDLELPLEADPVQIADGIVLPMPGKLRLLRPGNPGGKVEDYLVATDKEQASRWKHVLALSESDVAAVDDQGRLVRVQYRTAPVAHLAEVAARKLEALVESPLQLFDDRLLVSDVGGRIQKLDAASLETQTEAKLEAAISGASAILGGRLFVETAGNRLSCIDVRNECQVLWTASLEGAGLSGPPVAHQGRLLVALRDGLVYTIDVANGETVRKLDLGQPLCLEPMKMGEGLVAPSIDGSLYRLDALSQK